MRTLVIAEPGCTAEGKYETYVRLLETARACGADVWKPQWCSDPERMCERRQIGADHPERAYYHKAYSWLKFPVEWHADFIGRCLVLGMQYAVTVFLTSDVYKLPPVDYLKIASFENDDRELLEVAYQSGSSVIVSTGMTSDFRQRFKSFRNERRFHLLHCTSAYPAPPEHMNLRVLRHPWCHGLSDHSRNVTTGGNAATLGAQIIETHYRLDDCDPLNPDYAVAFPPGEFAQYIRNVRDAELMLGDGVKRIQPSEEWGLPYRVSA